MIDGRPLMFASAIKLPW